MGSKMGPPYSSALIELDLNEIEENKVSFK